MKPSRIWHLILLGAGIVLILLEGTVMGATTGLPEVPGAVTLVGFVVFSAGLFLLVEWEGYDETLEGKVTSVNEFAARFRRAEPDPAKRAIVLDASAIIPYTGEIETVLNESNTVYVPPSVLGEIKPDVRKAIVGRIKEMPDFERYRATARGYLEQGAKHSLYKLVTDALNGKPTSRREQQKIQEAMHGVRQHLFNKKKGQSLENIKGELEKHYKVSNADIEVISVALSLAATKQHVLVGERDIDIKEAVGRIKREKPELGKYIDVIEPYILEELQ